MGVCGIGASSARAQDFDLVVPPDYEQNRLKLVPDVVKLDAVKGDSVTMTLSNPSDARETVTLTPSFIATTTKDDLLTLAADTKQGTPSLVPALRGLPGTIILEPRSSQTFTVKLAPGTRLATGVSWARIIASGSARKYGVMTLTNQAFSQVYAVTDSAIGHAKPDTWNNQPNCLQLSIPPGGTYFGTLQMSLLDSAGAPVVVKLTMRQNMIAALTQLQPVPPGPFTQKVELSLYSAQSGIHGCLPMPKLSSGKYKLLFEVVGGEEPGMQKKASWTQEFVAKETP